MQQIFLTLTKPCSKVDKYEALDAQGNVIEQKNNPPVGPVYLRKDIAKGVARICITVQPL